MLDKIYSNYCINRDSQNLTASLRRSEETLEKIFSEMKRNVSRGFESLREEHYVTNAYGTMLREIRFINSQFEKIKKSEEYFKR